MVTPEGIPSRGGDLPGVRRRRREPGRALRRPRRRQRRAPHHVAEPQRHQEGGRYRGVGASARRRRHEHRPPPPMSAMATRVEQLVVDRWFRDPPPLIAAMAAKPTTGATRAFVLQWTKFSRLFPRWVGSIMSNCPEFPVIAYLVENLMSEVVRDPASNDNHYELLIKLGAGVGLTREEIESNPVLPESAATFEWLWQMARQADWLIGFTAVNGLEILGDSALPARYGVHQGTGIAVRPYAESLGLDGDALEFFEVSDAADAEHGSETVGIISRYTESGREDEVLGVLGESMDRLRTMMDAMWRLAVDIDGGVGREEMM